MWKKLAGCSVLVSIVVAFIMMSYPEILALNVEAVMPLGGKKFLVTGTIELERDTYIWKDPENFYWFNLWWQSDEAKQEFLEGSHGLVGLVSVEWEVIEEKENSDVLRFTLVVEAFPRALAPRQWGRGGPEI